MINVSNELRALLNSGNAPSPKIKIKVDGNIFGYDDETDVNSPMQQNDILSLTLNYIGASDDYPLGTANSNYAEVELWDVDSEITFQGKKTRIYVGYDINSSIEWINAGTFFPEKPSISGKVTSFTAYDRMKTLTSVYVPSDTASRLTVAGCLEDMAQQCSFTLAPIRCELAETVQLNPSLFTVSSSLDEEAADAQTGYSVQSCIAYLAGAAGCNAMFNRNDELQLYGFSDAYFSDDEQYVVTDNNTNNPFVSECEHIIQFVSCNNGVADLRSSQNSTIETGISISNPFITSQAHLDLVYSAISNADEPFAYRVMSLEHMTGDITLECYDIIKYLNADDKSFSFPLMSLRFTYDGGLPCLLSSFGKTSSEAQNENSTIKTIISDIQKNSSKIKQSSTSIEAIITGTQYVGGIATVGSTSVIIDAEGLLVGKSGSEFTSNLDNESLTFKAGDETVAVYSNDGETVQNIRATDTAILGGLLFKYNENLQRAELYLVGNFDLEADSEDEEV